MEITIARLPKLIDGKAPMVGIPGPTAFTNLDWSFPSAGKGAVFRIPGSLTLPPRKRDGGKAKWEVRNEQPPTRKPSHRSVYPPRAMVVTWSFYSASRLCDLECGCDEPNARLCPLHKHVALT
jgi:hypothetical protein